jgi:AcrR family transcriptional regulator
MDTTKHRILEEAVRLFAREGYEAVSVDEIAGAVGIKAPSLYKHYRSKRDIFDHILREMERRDADNASECEVPTGTITDMPETYMQSTVGNLLTFCRRQFRYWTEDDFAAAFRKMLTVEQYRSDEMNALYHQYLGSGPLQYTADLLGSKEAALALYGPMYLLYSVYDAEHDKDAVFARLDEHLKNWQELEKTDTFVVRGGFDHES